MNPQSSASNSRFEQQFGALGIALAAVVVVVSLNLRPVLTSVGPISDLIQAGTGLSTSAMGLLASVPVLCMGIGALCTPWIIRTIGMDSAVVAALVALGITTAIRSFVPGAGLWIGTVGIGLAIGVLNGVLPPIIKRDFPTRSTMVMGIYSAALTLGAAVASGVAVPIAGATSWRVATGIWLVLVVIGLAAWAWSIRARGSLLRINPEQHIRGSHISHAPRVNVWQNPLAWAITSFMGLQSFLFYTFVQWLPDLEKSNGISAEVAGVHMMLFQIAGLAATLLVTAIQGERPDQRWAAFATGVIWFVGLGGMLAAPSLALTWAIVVGLGSGASFNLALSFISTRTVDSYQASAVSGMSQSLGYVIAAIGPTLAGLMAESLSWDAVLMMTAGVAAAMMVLGVIAGRPVKISG